MEDFNSASSKKGMLRQSGWREGDKTNYQDTRSSFLLYFFSQHTFHYLGSSGEVTRIVRILSTQSF